jgi:hypothetical protein
MVRKTLEFVTAPVLEYLLFYHLFSKAPTLEIKGWLLKEILKPQDDYCSVTFCLGI